MGNCGGKGRDTKSMADYDSLQESLAKKQAGQAGNKNGMAPLSMPLSARAT